MPNQLELEEQLVAGVLQSTDNLTALFLRTSTSFINFLTSKELKFIFSLILSTYQTYTSLLTEQILSSALIERGASEEEQLKYCYTYKQLKKKSINETDFKFVINQLTDNYVSRSLIDSVLQSQELLQKEKSGQEAFDLLEKNMMLLKAQVCEKTIRSTTTRKISEVGRTYDDMVLHPEKYQGIKVGIDKLDELTGGFRSGELVIALGATGAGKSVFLMNAQYCTVTKGYNSLYVSIEMPKEQCERRLASRLSGLHYKKIKNCKLSPEELSKLKSDLDAFEKIPAHSIIEDIPEQCTPKMVEARVRTLMRKEKIDIVILDYLLLMAPSLPGFKGSREERYTQVALELKQMARSLNIPIITASQITGEAGKQRAKTADESYDWTDASFAKGMMAHADWVLSLKQEPDANIVNLGITKGRDGTFNGVVPLVADFERMKLGNFQITSEEPVPIDQQVTSADNF